MSVSFGATTAQVGGTTSAVPTMSAHAAGDMLVIAVHWWNSSDTPPTCSDGTWTKRLDVIGGDGAAFGVDTGHRNVSFWTKEATSGAEAAPTFTQTAGSGGSGMGVTCTTWTKSLGAWATPVGFGGSDSSVGTAFSCTASSDPGGTTGDALQMALCWSPDTATISGQTVTWTGTTQGSFTLLGSTANTQGNDARVVGYRINVTAGTSSAAPNFSATGSVNMAGSCGFLRLRDVDITRTGTLTASPAFSGVSVEVEVVSAALTAAPAFSASSSEVEFITGTLTAAPAFSGLAREVEVMAGTLTAGPAFSALAVEVELATGTLTAAPAFSALAAIVATTITVDIGDSWSQTWTLGQDIDGNDIRNVSGCILDNLTASWKAADVLTQPDPTVLSFGVYMPAAAAAPPELDQGTRVHVLITPPGWTTGTDYDPLLDFYGRISDGEAVPWAEGLKFTLNAVDAKAELGESQVGNGDWPHELLWHRVERIKDAMTDLGHGPLRTGWYTDTIWDLVIASDPSWDLSTPTGLENYRRLGMPAVTEGFSAYPDFPDRAGEGVPTLEMLTAVINTPGPKWVFSSNRTVEDYRYQGNQDLLELYQEPRALDWDRFPVYPYIQDQVDDDGQTCYQVVYGSPRVEHTAGLPLRADVIGGQLQLTAKGTEGTIPDTSRDGCWVPACAVPKDGITWRVDKQLYPNRVRLQGWWREDYDPPGSIYDWHWWHDVYFQVPESVAQFGPVERQLDLTYLAQPDMSETLATTEAPLNYGHDIGFGYLGFFSDSRPRYTVESIDILPRYIDNPDSWPRLFADPHYRPGDSYSYLGNVLGRFVFIYDIAAKWNPRGQSHYYGQLIGGTLTVSKGKLRMTAQLQQRRSGPNGPPAGAHPPDPAHGAMDLERDMLGADPTPALKWTDTPAGSALGDLTPLDTDPTITALDLWLTTAD